MKFYILLFLGFVLFSCSGTFRPFPAHPGGSLLNVSLSPSATKVNEASYKILGKSTGRASTFYFLSLIPLTRPLDIDYALSQAVTKVPKGQTMINLEIWIEKEYFFPMGVVISVNVKGDVIQYL